MGSMYKDTCFETTEDAAKSVASYLTWTNQGYRITSVTAGILPGEIFVDYEVDGVPAFDLHFAPSCTYTGLSNIMGVGVDDAVEASWLVALTLIAAWTVLVIKRTF